MSRAKSARDHSSESAVSQDSEECEATLRRQAEDEATRELVAFLLVALFVVSAASVSVR